MPVVLAAGPALDAADTVDTLVNDVYTHLEPSSFGYLNRLAEDVLTVDATDLVVEFGNRSAIKPGAYLCVDIEVLYVWDYDETTKTANVERGMLGSVPTTHTAGALIQIQPRVSKYDVTKQIRADIRSWPPALFVPAVYDLVETANTRGYDFPVDGVTRILDVLATDTGDTSPRRVSGWRYEPNADTAVYPSGKAIIFPTGTTARADQVVYAAPFDTDAFTLTTQLADIGLTSSLLEIPVLGAAARLVREAPRTDTRAQGQSRLAEEVPPMHLTNTAKSLMKMRDDRVHQEIARLRESYPQRRT